MRQSGFNIISHSHRGSRRWLPCFVVVVCAAVLWPQSAAAQCDGDVTGDGVVDIFDLLDVLACWGDVAAGCEAADLTDDGIVDIFDLLAVLAAWGPCACVPQCSGVQCGDDGCGGSCGTCPSGQMCQDGACVAVTGACCYSSTECAVLTQAQCTGSYQGDGTVCPPGPSAWALCSTSCASTSNCGQAASETCWCDSSCAIFNDCCPDACSYCGSCG